MSKCIGYCRVSSVGQLDGNGLEVQKNEILSRYPNAEIYEEQYSGKTTDRPIFNTVVDLLEVDDILIVSKLDRFCRNTKEGLEAIDALLEKGVRIHILNMGLIEDTPMGKLIITNLLAFAEFERSMIIERTQSAKAIAKLNPNFKEGRPKKYSDDRLHEALKLLNNGMSYNSVSSLTGISKSTLIRFKNKIKGDVVN